MLSQLYQRENDPQHQRPRNQHQVNQRDRDGHYRHRQADPEYDARAFEAVGRGKYIELYSGSRGFGTECS